MTTINLDAVVEILRGTHGLNAEVQMTGGGIATIYAGAKTYDEGDCYYRWAAIAGPGTYRTDEPSTAALMDFYVGPDDDGATDPTEPASVGAHDEFGVAKIIAAQAKRPDPTQSLSADEIEALGFDPTGRSYPPEVYREKKRVSLIVNANNAVLRACTSSGVPGEVARALAEKAGKAAAEAYDATQQPHPEDCRMFAGLVDDVASAVEALSRYWQGESKIPAHVAGYAFDKDIDEQAAELRAWSDQLRSQG